MTTAGQLASRAFRDTEASKDRGEGTSGGLRVAARLAHDLRPATGQIASLGQEIASIVKRIDELVSAISDRARRGSRPPAVTRKASLTSPPASRPRSPHVTSSQRCGYALTPLRGTRWSCARRSARSRVDCRALPTPKPGTASGCPKQRADRGAVTAPTGVRQRRLSSGRRSRPYGRQASSANAPSTRPATAKGASSHSKTIATLRRRWSERPGRRRGTADLGVRDGRAPGRCRAPQRPFTEATALSASR